MQLTHANERLARAKASASSALAAAGERMEQLKAEYNTLSSDRETNDKQLDALQHEATSIENDVRYTFLGASNPVQTLICCNSQMATHIAENQLAMQKVLTEYHRLRQQWGKCV